MCAPARVVAFVCAMDFQHIVHILSLKWRRPLSNLPHCQLACQLRCTVKIAVIIIMGGSSKKIGNISQMDSDSSS